MFNSDSQSKRLAKNTIMLYMRTFLIMAISLFTSRVILNALGIEDYGIYNVVGGFVAFFSIVSGSLVATTQRFITVELGKKDNSNPQKIFSAAMIIHIILVVIVLLLFETVGLWYLNNSLNIPSERLASANWVYQFSIFTFILTIISSPYTAVVIAHEKIKAFAYIGLFDTVLKLIFVYLIYICFFDKLVFYAFCMMLVSLIDRLIYQIYCKLNFSETKLTIVYDRELYKDIFGFAGMNFLGACASILANQGMDIMLNLFFGVTINAAKGVANQVMNAISRFVNDFMTALDPQITKEYAAGNKTLSQQLCFRGSRFAFYLMLLFAVPVFFRAPYILKLWLDVFPEYAVLFVRCSLILSLFTVLSKPLITVILATGNLKNTVLWIGSTILFTLPIAYICFKCGMGPEFSYFTLIFVELVTLFVRLVILEKITGMKFVMPFLSSVLIRITLVLSIVYLTNAIINDYIGDYFLGLILYSIISIFIGFLIMALFGLSRKEQSYIIMFINKKIGYDKN